MHTPYELWFNRKPSVDHLRAYGCSAWVHIPKNSRGKFSGKAKKLTFIGYSEEKKAYRFVDLKTAKITVNRDAKFLENEPPNSYCEERAGSQRENNGVVVFDIAPFCVDIETNSSVGEQSVGELNAEQSGELGEPIFSMHPLALWKNRSSKTM